jgi:hypothetical protein
MVTTPEPVDDFEPWPAEPDPIRTAVSQLIVAVMGVIPDGPARAAAVTEIIELHGRVAALLGRPRLN